MRCFTCKDGTDIARARYTPVKGFDMQQLMNAPTPQAPVLAKDKIIQAAKESKGKEGSKDGGDFLNLMLSQLNSSGTKITQKMEVSIETIKIESKSLEGIKNLSIEEATFGQLLQFLEALHGKSNEPLSFLNLSSKLKNLLTQEGILQEFKSAKNLEDIMKLSKTYNLNLEKLTLTSSEAKQLEKIFPNLAKKGFFELKNSNLSSQEWLATKNRNITPTQAQQKEETPTLKDLLSGLDKGEKRNNPTQTENLKAQTKEIPADRAQVKSATKPEIKGEVKSNIKGELKGEIKSEAKPEIKGEVKSEVKSEVKPELKGEVKPEIKGEVKTESKSEVKPEIKGEVKSELKGEVKSEIKGEVKTESKSEVKSELKGEVKPEINPKKVETKDEPRPTRAQEIRLETPKPNTPPPTSERDNSLSTKDTTLKSLSELSQNSSQSNSQGESSSQEKGSDSSLMNRENIKAAQQQLKTPQLRQTFNTFAQDFREQVEQYKPPMMKIQMALNPKNLGEVEVTLINRGNNLHVSFTSNTQTLSLFVQNQAEFKNALVNMGFTNLEMNFSQKEEKGQDPRNSSGFNGDNEHEEESLEEEATLELTLPNYV